MKKWVCANLFLAVALAGCDAGPHVVRVKGTVTRQGKPVPNVTVHFVPESGRAMVGFMMLKVVGDAR